MVPHLLGSQVSPSACLAPLATTTADEDCGRRIEMENSGRTTWYTAVESYGTFRIAPPYKVECWHTVWQCGSTAPTVDYNIETAGAFCRTLAPDSIGKVVRWHRLTRWQHHPPSLNKWLLVATMSTSGSEWWQSSRSNDGKPTLTTRVGGQ